jgi:PAS domain-containing protein
LTGGVGSWIEFGLRALYIPLTGAIVGLAAEGYVEAEYQHRDAQRRLVDAIETMDRRFAAVLEDAPDRIVLTDTEGTVEYANGSVVELGLAHATDPRASGIHDAAIRSAMADGETVEYVVDPETCGARTPFWCRVAPIEDGGEAVGAVLTARETSQAPDLDDVSNM